MKFLTVLKEFFFGVTAKPAPVKVYRSYRYADKPKRKK